MPLVPPHLDDDLERGIGAVHQVVEVDGATVDGAAIGGQVIAGPGGLEIGPIWSASPRSRL